MLRPRSKSSVYGIIVILKMTEWPGFFWEQIEKKSIGPSGFDTATVKNTFTLFIAFLCKWQFTKEEESTQQQLQNTTGSWIRCWPLVVVLGTRPPAQPFTFCFSGFGKKERRGTSTTNHTHTVNRPFFRLEILWYHVYFLKTILWSSVFCRYTLL